MAFQEILWDTGQLEQVKLNINLKDKTSWWNDTFEDKSDKLWVPLKANLVKVLQPLGGHSCESFKPKKYHEEHRTIRIPYQTFNPKEKNFKMRKIQFYPSDTLYYALEEWFNASRYMYNKCVKEFHKTKICNHFELRKKVLPNNKDLVGTPEEWLIKIPNKVKDLVIKEFCAMVKSAKTNFARGHIHHFEMKFKRKKEESQTCHMDCKAVNKSGILLPNIINEYLDTFRQTEIKRYFAKNPSYFQFLKKDKKYFLLLPQSYKVEANNQPHGIVALDPGVRSFQSFYSPDGLVGLVNPNPKFLKLHKKIKMLVNLRLKKTKIRKALKRLRNKVANLRDDFHWQTCNMLCKTFDTIIIPNFGVKQMVKKSKKRKIRQYTVDKMLSLAHYKFRMRLTFKVQQKNVHLLVVNEAYTTKTCGWCGVVNNNVGSNKIFNCKSCSLKCDRDYHAARNIALKTLSPSL